MTQPDSVTQANAEILRTAYEAFAAGDVAAVLAVFSDDVTFRIPGRNPLSGDYTGHDEVTSFFQALAERSEGTFGIEVEDILDNGDDTVVALVTHTGQRGDRRLTMPAVHVWRLRDGKATRHESIVVDDHESDEFWS
jgi:ketosteroid isomerase-like protein